MKTKILFFIIFFICVMNLRASNNTKIFFIADDIKLEMILVNAGNFMLGSVEKNINTGEQPHKVSLEDDYYIGKYEVTQVQWNAIMMQKYKILTTDTEYNTVNFPVVKVSWEDCQEFIKKLNNLFEIQTEIEGKKFGTFRLPKEAEWEYAARGGHKSQGYLYSGSNNMDEVGWYYENSGIKKLDENNWDYDVFISNKCQSHEVGLKAGNELGIYDMSGNVWEWCQDLYNESGKYRIVRGGAFDYYSKYCQVIFQTKSLQTNNRDNNLGFRLVYIEK